MIITLGSDGIAVHVMKFIQLHEYYFYTTVGSTEWKYNTSETETNRQVVC